MNIVQITPGAGGMFCGGCFRDNALVAALRKLGHDTLMVPLYLPLTLDERDQSANTPIFFSGVNVYLEQKFPWFRRAPKWLHHAFASRGLLKALGPMAGRTRAEDVGEMTISMLRGEQGNQAREVEELAEWLKANHRADVISLSNVLLVGVARTLKQKLGAPIVCMLQGEDTFLDGLPGPVRDAAWRVARERAGDVDVFIAPSRYFAELMTGRLGLNPSQVRVVPNGISMEGYAASQAPAKDRPPVLGYFARMCEDKGLGLATDAFIQIKKRGRVPGIRFHAGGGCGPSDAPFVEEQKGRLEAAGALDCAEFFPNVTREQKIEFFRGIDVLSTPALYGEAFGLYVIEALAAGVPVVQPRHAAFPELIEQTGGGIVAEPNAEALAAAVEELLLNPEKARGLGAKGREAVLQRFNVDSMATGVLNVFQEAARKASSAAPAASR